MCVLLGDSLDNYGTVLWGGAALWSKVKELPLAAACILLRSDLMVIVVSSIRMHAPSPCCDSRCFLISYSYVYA